MKYRYVIFDLDGTLLDTLDDLSDSVGAALEAHGYPPRTRQEVQAFVGNGVGRLVELSVPQGTSAEDTASCLATFKEIYAAGCRNKTAPYEGICPLLAHLKQAGVGVAIVSNKIDSAVKTLADTYFPGLIGVAVGEQESRGIRKKPHPDTLLQAMSVMGASPADTVYVGDSEVDILTARNAGIPCLSVTWGFRSPEELKAAGATHLISTAEELAKQLALPIEIIEK